MSNLSTVPDLTNNNTFLNQGKPVVGNTGVANPNNSAGGPMPLPIVGAPSGTLGLGNGGLVSGQPPQPPLSVAPVYTPGNGSGITANSTIPGTLSTTGVASSAVPTATTPGVGTGATAGTIVPNLDNGLNSTYGSGLGSLISSEIGNLGSNDSSYMQAYDKAMGNSNAEQMATLQTTLGNEGVSGNSSTAAIAQSDLLSQETSQEGLQEQQLQENDLSQLLGLTESVEGSVAQEYAASSPMAIFGDIASGVGDIAGGVLGLGGISGLTSGGKGGGGGLMVPGPTGLQTQDPSFNLGGI